MRMYYYPCLPAFSLVSLPPPLARLILWKQRSSDVQNLPTASLFTQSKTHLSPVACELPQRAPSSLPVARLWRALLLHSGLLAGPGALLPQGLCSHWMLTPSSFWSSSNTTFPVQLSLTSSLTLWFPISTLRALLSASFFSTAISHTTNVITVSNPSLLIYGVYYLLPL